MAPYFSIVIPTLNEEGYVSNILKDLKKQKEKNFETIIVDASSSDKTREKALQFGSILSIRLFQVSKKNVAYQRNYGALKAKGSYLVFLDADSGISPSFTKNLKKLIVKKKGLLFIPYVNPEEKYPQVAVVFNLINLLVELSQSFNKPFSSGGVMFVEKNFFINIGGFDEKLFLGEDHNLVQKALSWGIRAKFLKNIKVKFSLRRMKKEGQLTTFYKFITSSIYILFKGDIKNKIYNYPMGGHPYKLINNEVRTVKPIKFYLKQIENFFVKYLES